MRNHFDPAMLPQLEAYIADHFAEEDAALRFARQEAERAAMPAIHIRATDGRLLQLFALAIGARRIVEIGTLAGYSGLWLARALPPDGQLYTLEGNPRHAAVARRVFAQAGLSERVTVIEGEARDSLKRLADGAPYDMLFIDADKADYPDYLVWGVAHLRPGGVIAAHNALRDGRIIAPENEDDLHVRRFNQMVAEHERLAGTIVAIGDGMLVAVVKQDDLAAHQ